ncbi:hypothetical protein ACFX2I_008561 [Malus domestica]|uniref:uncharacterized protein n=1 Tax=Malus domestica TaxID=3750 RepID=UPI0039764FD9
MGNCLVMQENITKVMRPDGKILEYRADMKVYQVLSEFSGHAISETAPVYQHLRPDSKLLGGHLYYLVPLPLPPPKKASQKKVRFSEPAEAEPEQETKVVRIKLVIRKQELQEMLIKGGVAVLDEMVSRLQSEKGVEKSNTSSFNDDGKCEGWKPVLQSIPELN